MFFRKPKPVTPEQLYTAMAVQIDLTAADKKIREAYYSTTDEGLGATEAVNMKIKEHESRLAVEEAEGHFNALWARYRKENNL